MLFVNRERCGRSNHGLTPVYQLEDAFAVYLHLKRFARLDLWCDGRRAEITPYKAGAMIIYRLDRAWHANMIDPFDCLHIHVPRSVLDEISWESGLPRISDLRCPPYENTYDPVAHALGMSLLPALEYPERANRLFIEHVAFALNLHLAMTYGGMRAPSLSVTGGLSPWQMRRATDYMMEHLDGEVSLLELANHCGLSRSHFARAFKISTGLPPDRWLRKQRVERARELLTCTTLSLTEIATACGFADQSHFSRVFSALTSVTPNRFRRANQ